MTGLSGHWFSPLALSLGLALSPLTTMAAEKPVSGGLPRVISLNLCTDQLLLALADPEQIASLSYLSRDASLSPIWRDARAFPVNHARAEEVFLQQPDIVVTGTFSQFNTTHLLRKSGFKVEEFPFDMTLDSIPHTLRRMGQIVGHSARGDAAADGFEAKLADLGLRQCDMPPERRPTILAYEQNGITPGLGTIADSLFTAAGLRNIAAEAGLIGTAPLPLEIVVTRQPDIIVVSGNKDEAPTLGAYVTRHPALEALKNTQIGAYLPEGSFVCNGPLVLEALEQLVRLREERFPCEAGMK